jgi:hypothetical protein
MRQRQTEQPLVVRLVAFLSFGFCGYQSPLVLVEEARVENEARLMNLGALVISESARWFWITLSDIDRPLVALPHAYDKSWFFIIRDKHERGVWQ